MALQIDLEEVNALSGVAVENRGEGLALHLDSLHCMVGIALQCSL